MASGKRQAIRGRQEGLGIIQSLYFCIITYFTILFSIYIMSEGSPNNVNEIYFMTKTTTDRYFLPIHSLLILCSIYISNKKNNNNKWFISK